MLAVRVGAVDGLDVVLQAGEALQGETALVARRWVLGRGGRSLEITLFGLEIALFALLTSNV